MYVAGRTGPGKSFAVKCISRRKIRSESIGQIQRIATLSYFKSLFALCNRLIRSGLFQILRRTLAREKYVQHIVAGEIIEQSIIYYINKLRYLVESRLTLIRWFGYV